MLILKGVSAGFRGEFDIAAHFLVPKVEEIVRHVLKRNGHVTSVFKGKSINIQQEQMLGTLLALPETAQIFPDSFIFELRGFLIEKFGFDLRNRLAHGFLTHKACWGIDVINVWWLIVRLLCYPIEVAMEETVQTE